MTFFEYIKNEATAEQIAHMLNELGDNISNDLDGCDCDYDYIVNAINCVIDKKYIGSDDKIIKELNFDVDRYNEILKEIKELSGYISEIKEALKNEDNDKLYELVNIVIHKYKDYITIEDVGDKRIIFKYYEHGFHCYERIITVNSKIYNKMIANDDK